MRARRKNENRSDWCLTVEYFGRELRKLYPPVDVPPALHALFTRERRRTRANAPKLPQHRRFERGGKRRGKLTIPKKERTGPSMTAGPLPMRATFTP
jgi:hypothetical protein